MNAKFTGHTEETQKTKYQNLLDKNGIKNINSDLIRGQFVPKLVEIILSNSQVRCNY